MIAPTRALTLEDGFDPFTDEPLAKAAPTREDLLALVDHIEPNEKQVGAVLRFLLEREQKLTREFAQLHREVCDLRAENLRLETDLDNARVEHAALLERQRMTDLVLDDVQMRLNPESAPVLSMARTGTEG